MLLQKTFTDEHFNRKVNQGELDQYLIENHHEAIITHADFEAANRMLEYQASQKNVAVGSRKYLNRYPFSGKIECAECGDTFKRRIHTSTHRKYIAWCCSTQIKNRDECSMLFINEVLGNKDNYLKILIENIETVLNENADKPTADIDEKLEELQMELLRLANSKEDYDDVTEEIYRLRELKQEVMMKNVAREGLIR
ncbi:putative recombinase [Amphibacillus xylanus NBRC 15112]|uniref:Putative recombinase n=2 Tax=Amphibacillus xylanus TaxID=1449 RepID=K0J6F9_AMPXN|nr:putative recombinase [Amphibacillus xylanus NBRC 15112]